MINIKAYSITDSEIEIIRHYCLSIKYCAMAAVICGGMILLPVVVILIGDNPGMYVPIIGTIFFTAYVSWVTWKLSSYIDKILNRILSESKVNEDGKETKYIG